MASWPKTVLVTGGAGFIGSHLVELLAEDSRVIVLDKLTYAADSRWLRMRMQRGGVELVEGDICDRALIANVLTEFQPESVIHLAAESHVDRSIDAADAFMRTNVMGTFELLEGVRSYLASASSGTKSFRFVHVSTDEVYGSVAGEKSIREGAPYAPTSPYAASKAASDHVARSYHATYGLPVIVTAAANNHGPRQYPEKLIPVVIHRALSGKSIPLYGDGSQIRQWTRVEDHCEALIAILRRGRVGATYHITSGEEATNAWVVATVLDELKKLGVESAGEVKVERVTDRPGHDRCYRLSGELLATELGWRARWGLEAGLRDTVRWYVDHADWIAERLKSTGGYCRRGLADLEGLADRRVE